MHPIFVGNTKKGKLTIQNQDKFDLYILGLGEKEVAIIVKGWRRPRTNPQNRFMWGVCYQLISEVTGYTREEVHDAMRLMFLKDETRDLPTLKSTTSLTTIEMNEYWERIQQFAAEKLNIMIPNPNEVEV